MAAQVQLRVAYLMGDRHALSLSLASTYCLNSSLHTQTNTSSQPFWGNMVAVAGAGPAPIDHKKLDASTLSAAIRFLLSPSALSAAEKIAMKMSAEDGVKTAVASFHRYLSVKDLSCDLVPDHPATWALKDKKGKGRQLKLSHRAASVLVEKNKIDVKHLRL